MEFCDLPSDIEAGQRNGHYNRFADRHESWNSYYLGLGNDITESHFES